MRAPDGLQATAKIQCSYFGCDNEIIEKHRNNPPPSMRFCKKHDEEISGYIVRGEIPKILGFWVKANGGAKRLAETF